MPIGYNWFSKYPEDEMRNFIIEVSDDIHFYFKDSVNRSLSSRYNISYKKNESRTKVSSSKENKTIEVEESVIEVFCEDFREFLMNQNSILTSLEVCGRGKEADRIFECMETALERRKEKLQVKDIRFDIFNSNQVISLLKYINLEVLTSIYVYFGDSEEIDDLINYIIKWNQGCRLAVIIGCSNLSMQKLTIFKRMLSYPLVFSRIRLEFEDSNGFSRKELITFFEPLKPLFSIRNQNPFEGECIEFYLKEDLVDQISGLSIQDVRSLKVFANPLLMKIILQDIDFFDVQTLRKVSSDIRSCIDILKPDPDIASYEIKRIEADEMSDFDQWSSHPLQTHIILRNGRKKCIRHPKDSVGYPTNKAVFNFNINIFHLKSKMDRLSLESYGNLLELIGDKLVSRETPLQVKELRIQMKYESDIMNILPYLDAVESIHFFQSFNCLWNLCDVFKLDQWKNGQKLEIKNCTIKNSIQDLNVINFKELDIKINSLSTNDVINLKENLTRSTQLIKFKIEYFESLIDENLFTSMPPYHRVLANRITSWFFPMQSQFLHILFYEQKKLIFFKRVDRDFVPDDFF